MQGQPPMMYNGPVASSMQGFLPSKPAYASHSSMGKVASPQPMHQKAAFLYQHDGQPLTLDTECGTPDVHLYPSTPPLSVSGSTVSSPPSTCGLLPTPLTGHMFALENIEGVKQGCEGDVQSEILAGGEWTRSCSPPLTPGMFFSCVLYAFPASQSESAGVFRFSVVSFYHVSGILLLSDNVEVLEAVKIFG